MSIDSSDSGDVTISRLSGSLDTNTSPEVDQHLKSLVEGGARKIAIDCGDLDFISSAGLRVLLSCAKQLRTSGGELRIFGLNEVVNEVFEISGFSKILNVFESQEQAVTEF